MADVIIPSRILMGPGPSNIHSRVLQAMALPTLGHMDPLYFKLMDQLAANLKTIFRTSAPLTLTLPVTGMGAMEACLVNLLEPGDEALFCVAGFFANRMPEIAKRLGVKVHVLETPWGGNTAPEKLAAALKANKIKLVGLVHGETSTGVVQTNLPEIAKLCHDNGALLLVDTVASLGGVDFETEKWDIDAVYTGSQKCLSAPPGISPLTFGPRAEDALKKRKTPCASWYMDLGLIRKYWDETRAYHHTGPIHLTYALLEAVKLMNEEGHEARLARHAKAAKALQAGFEAMGLKLFVEDPKNRLATVTTVCIPDGCDDKKVRKALIDRHSLEVGGGIGQLAGKTWRVGLMGEGARANHVLILLSALGGILKAEGHKVHAGAGVEAAAAVLLT